MAQSRDYRPLPGGYGMGSGTLAAGLDEGLLPFSLPHFRLYG